MANALDQMELVELYGAASELEAHRIVLLLEEDAVEALARATTVSSFPAAGESQHLILVRTADVERARALIEMIRGDGAISTAGTFL